MIALLFLNAAAAAAGITLALIAAVRPSRLFTEGGDSPGERFYARMYAGKAVPLGALAALLPFAGSSPATGLVLVVAACSQAADAVLGLRRQDSRQVVGSLAAMTIHAVVGLLIW